MKGLLTTCRSECLWSSARRDSNECTPHFDTLPSVLFAQCQSLRTFPSELRSTDLEHRFQTLNLEPDSRPTVPTAFRPEFRTDLSGTTADFSRVYRRLLGGLLRRLPRSLPRASTGCCTETRWGKKSSHQPRTHRRKTTHRCAHRLRGTEFHGEDRTVPGLASLVDHRRSVKWIPGYIPSPRNSSAGFTKLENSPRKITFTVPVGPLRCLPMMISALRLSSSSFSNSGDSFRLYTQSR